MRRDRALNKRMGMGAILLVLLGFVTGVGAEASKTLSFPSDGWMGNLYLEPESGPGWHPEGVRLLGQWEYLGAARGDVLVPENRNVKLGVVLELTPRESARFRAENPQYYQQVIADRTHGYAKDLSGLSKLDPNDVFWLTVGSLLYRRTGVAPRMFEPIRHLTGLEILSLRSSGVTDEGLEHLRPLRSLRGLELTQFTIGNRGLAVLKDLPALEYLALNTSVTDAGLKQVAQLSNLRWLRIVDGKMWGPGLAELALLPRLERLCIHQGRGQISDRHIKHLEGLTQLKSLTLWSGGCDTLTDASLASIGKLQSLEELHFITSRPKFTPGGLAHLRGLKNLKKLHFAQMWISPAGERYGDDVARQLAALPHLESIRGVAFLSAEGLKTLATCRNLKCLHVALKDRKQDYYGPTGLSHLAGLSTLEELAISSGDTLSHADLASLEPLSRLRDLRISGPGVTDQGLASIGRLRQLERLDLHTATRSGLNHLNGLSNLQYLQATAWGPGAEAAQADELMLDLSGLEKMKDLNLSGLPLHDGDLAFLEHMPALESLMIQPDSLTAASLRHLRELPELNRLFVSGLSGCTGADLAHLNGLPKLRSLTLRGSVTDTALASLTGPASLESLRVDTDDPIRKETVADLTASHPEIEYIHIHDLTPVQTPPASGPRTNRPVPTSRRRGRR
jgi:hypothetical protein